MYSGPITKIVRAANHVPNLPDSFCVVRYRSKDDFAVLSMVQHGLGISILPELTLERFPGRYEYRMLDPESYRSLGIGIRSIKEAGPLARSVINYIKNNIR